MLPHRLPLLLLACLLLVPAATVAESLPGGAPPADPETSARVPELEAYHEVIARIWHDAWPAKNVPLLVELAPEVKRGADAVVAAKLPGILRERQAAWSAAVDALAKEAASYGAAAAAKDGPVLLSSAEALHARFEQAVRAIRPVLPEIQAFHTVLYRAYHREAPAGDLAALRLTAPELQQKQVALDAAVLGSRHASKREAFEAARTKLRGSVAAFAALPASAPKETVVASLETLHSDYQGLEHVFD